MAAILGIKDDDADAPNLDDLAEFLDQARKMGVPGKTPLEPMLTGFVIGVQVAGIRRTVLPPAAPKPAAANTTAPKGPVGRRAGARKRART